MRLPKILSVKLSHWLVLLLGLTFILRIPSFFEPYWYGDEGIYLTVGQALGRGLGLYKDIYDNKPPLLYLLAALCQTQTSLRTILLLWNLFNVYLIYRLALFIFKKELPALISGFLFMILSLLPEGNIANGEIFMIMPTTAAMLLLYKVVIPAKAGIQKNKNYFLVGVLFSLAFLFKIPAGFSFAAAITFLVFEFLQGQTLQRARSDLEQKAINLLSLMLGFLVLPLLTIIYFWGQGTLPLYWQATFKQNVGYLSSWQGGSVGLTQRGLILLAIAGGLFLGRKHFSRIFLLTILWFFFDLFGALLSGRPYPHYLIQAAPALSLLLVFPWVRTRVTEKIFVLAALSLLAAAFFYYRFWHYPVWNYYENFYQFAVGKKTRQAYFDFFDKRVSETYQIASYIKTLTQPADRIFVWGDEPYLYALSRRLPAGRYTVAYHVIDFNGWQETLTAIEKNQPKLIIKVKNSPAFDDLDQILARDYLKIAELEKAVIFQNLHFAVKSP